MRNIYKKKKEKNFNKIFKEYFVCVCVECRRICLNKNDELKKELYSWSMVNL